MKPSEKTSLFGLKIAEVFHRAGLPAGVLNLVPGDGPTVGPVLFSDPRVRLISFAGSTAVGKLSAVKCAKHGKKVVLKLGGESPLVILKDADSDYAVSTACFEIFIHQGQIGMAGSRIIVEALVYDEFLQHLVAKVKTLKVGDPRDPQTVIGPLSKGDAPHRHAAVSAESAHRETAVPSRFIVSSSIEVEPISLVDELESRRCRSQPVAVIAR